MVARSERYEAKTQGRTTYFTGKPCRQGHVAERFTHSGSCAECIRLRLEFNRRAKGVQPVSRMPAAVFKEKRRALDARWKAKNRDRLNADARVYYLANKEEVDRRNRERARADPDAATARAKHHRAKRRGAEGSHTRQEVAALFQHQRGQCAACPSKLLPGYHEDHIHPLSRGGSDYIENIQLLCPPCNHSKGAKTMDEWLGRKARAA